VVGTIEGERVALFQGRGHYYERGDPNAMRIAIDTFRQLGGETLLLANAAGGLKTEWRAADAGRDHRSYQLFRNESADRPSRPGSLRAADQSLQRERCSLCCAKRREAQRSSSMRASTCVFRAELRDAGRDSRGAHSRRDLVGMSTCRR